MFRKIICASMIIGMLATINVRADIPTEVVEEIHIPDTAAAEAYRKSQLDLHRMTATAYCLNGTTATGTQTRHGVAAGKREWFGKTVRVYHNNDGAPGDLIGEYVIEDTGGSPIRKGHVIDIWMSTRDECMNFGKRSVLVEIVD